MILGYVVLRLLLRWSCLVSLLRSGSIVGSWVLRFSKSHSSVPSAMWQPCGPPKRHALMGDDPRTLKMVRPVLSKMCQAVWMVLASDRIHTRSKLLPPFLQP